MLGIQHFSREPLLSGCAPEWNPYSPQLILNVHPLESQAPITNRGVLDAPGGWAYPQAPEFEQRADARFRRGYGYFHQYHATSAAKQKSRLVRIVAPPEITAVQFKDGCAHVPHVQGMVEMQAGIPYVALVNGNNAKAVTVGCFQTLHSLDQYLEGESIRALVIKLQTQTWGKAANTSKESKVSPVYSFPGLKPNDRSGKVKEGSVEGSYSLASTVMKGNGCGILRPALQVSTPEAKEQISNILATLHGLYRLIVPLSISKEEWEVFEHVMRENNGFSFGGLEPGAVGCQMNVSECSSGGELLKSIGDLQGSWHVDSGDDPLSFTLLTILLRIPPGMIL